MPKLFLNEQQIQRLLRRSHDNPRDFALFHTAFATGFRAGDLLALKRQDVAPDGRVVQVLRIKMQKTGDTVERPLPSACQKAITRYLNYRVDSNPFLFRSESTKDQEREGPMNRSSLHRLIKSYLSGFHTNDDLRGNACHITRRSMAKLISDRAGRVEPATKFLGHKSIKNTIAYLDMDQYGKQANEIVESLPWN